MLALDNNTPYAAERTIVMDKRGAKSWVVAVKATYSVHPDGATELAANQKEALFTPEYRGEPGKSSIVYDADLVPTKPATDVILNGHAYAPGGEPAKVVDVSLRAGPLHKRLRVFGERRWEMGLVRALVKSAPDPFARMPITYERAFGGWDTKDADPKKHRLYARNPIGMGFATHPAHLEGQPLPNIEDPDNLIAAWNDRPPPGGFGAIASYWTPRRERGGTYDDRWKKEKFPLLPDDFDDRFFQIAPEDQQVAGYLRGGEEVTLENLCAAGTLRFCLPKVYLAFTTWFGAQSQEHRASLQTVIIEPDAPLVTLVWQTRLDCHHLLDKLDVTVIREKRYI